MRFHITFATLLILSCLSNVEAQQPAAGNSFLLPPSIPYGSRIQRTMHLLATSTPEHKHRVRILFYGQSITNTWTDAVLKDLQTRFPNADIVCENRAIGGFGSTWLSETAEADLYPFYPDLLFIQDYGALDPAMERMFAAVHDRTTADVLVFTHHMQGTKNEGIQKAHDDESAKLRELSEKYGYEVVDVRPCWQAYLKNNNLDASKLVVADLVHLNPDGQSLMAKIAMPHLRYIHDQSPEDGKNHIRYYDASGALLKGSFDQAQGAVLKKPLRIEFEGNRIDIAAMPIDGKLGTAKILIDGRNPSELPAVYATTRTNVCPGNWFPALRRVELGQKVVAEKWDLTITKINENCSEFEYDVRGSVTGPDGHGTSKQKFTSNSGRLLIDPAWFTITQSYQIFKKPIPAFTITWQVIEQFANEWKPQPIKDRTREDLYTLAQGFPNGRHTLEIIPNNDGPLPVNYIITYQPAQPITQK